MHAAGAAAQTPTTPAQPSPDRVAPPPTLVVTAQALRRDAASGLSVVDSALPAIPQNLPPRIADDARRLEPTLAAWIRRGRAAGNRGDVYDNRDRGHSSLPPRQIPSVVYTAYDDSLRAADLDYGLNTEIRFPAPVFGNSSTALTGPFWRSQTRHAMGGQALMLRVAALYRANHLYVYPEHRDHDPARGDLFPAIIPYVITSQGSSGSDRAFLRAIATILAAFRPDTKKVLIERGDLAAVTATVLRRGMKGIESDADYLSGKAHPSAFRGDGIDLERMVLSANTMTVDRLPPSVSIAVRAAPRLRPGIDSFQDGSGETLFVTDQAVGWIARAMVPAWRFVLEARTSHPETARVHWRLLRGNPDKVDIEPLDASGRRVAVTIRWHDAFGVPVEGDVTSASAQGDLLTRRVDIGVFAEARGALSPPAYFSLAFPPCQERRHATDGRLIAVVHDPRCRRDGYADPLLYALADWTDRFHHDAGGQLTGWTRESPTGTQRFTSLGLLVLETDQLDRPVLVQEMRYPVEATAGGRNPRIVPTAGERRWAYRYADDDDRTGVPVPAPQPETVP